MAGLSFTNLVDRSRRFRIKFDNNETLELEYRPDKITAATIRKMNEALAEEDELAFARLLCEVIASWELEGPFAEDTECEVAAGEPIPITPEHLGYIPGPHLGYIWRAIAEDANPDPKKRERRSTGR